MNSKKTIKDTNVDNILIQSNKLILDKLRKTLEDLGKLKQTWKDVKKHSKTEKVVTRYGTALEDKKSNGKTGKTGKKGKHVNKHEKKVRGEEIILE